MFTGLSGLIDAFLRTGIGPLMHARDNPRAYPVMLGVIGVALIMTVAGLVLRGRKVSAAIGEIVGFDITLALLWLVWVVIATPATALPFWRVSTPTDTWWFLSASAVYAFIAVTLRTIALLILSYCVAATWIIQLTGTERISMEGLPAFLFTTVWLSPLVLFAETRPLPLLYTGLVETLGVILIAFTAGYILKWLFVPADPKPTFGVYKRGRTLDRLSDAVIDILLIAGALLLAYTHPLANDWLQLVALFGVLTLIDGAIMRIWASLKQDKRDPDLLAPRRWLLTIPLTVAIGTLGANGVLTPYLGATHILPSIWTTASAAAAAYMLFQPLVSLATYVAGVRARQQSEFTPMSVGRMLNFIERIGLPGPGAAGAAGRVHQPQPDQDSAPTENVTIKEYLRLGGRDVDRERELHIYENLNFPTWWVILVVMILLRLGLLYVHLAGGFNNLLVTFIFGLITLIAGAINLFDNKTLVATRPVFLMLVLVISVVAVTSLGTAIPAISAAPGAQEFFQTVQQLLIVMTVGQLAYLYRVVDATISSEQAETEDPDTEGLADYAYSLYRASQYESAIQIYDEVNQKYPENANAWHLKGYAHLMLNDGEYSDAIAAVTEAIRLIKDQEAPEALNSHGDYLDSLGRIYQKIGETQESADHTQDSDAFKNARRCCVESLRYRPNNADTLTLLAQVFRSLGEEAEAQKVDAQLAALKVKQT